MNANSGGQRPPGTDEPSRPAEPTAEAAPEDGIYWVHAGHSANCSSVGSVVDYLLLAGTAGAALLSAVAAWLTEDGADGSAAPQGADATDAPEGPPSDPTAVGSAPPTHNGAPPDGR